MDKSFLSKALHVVSGDTTAAELVPALKLSSDQVLVNEDVLSLGPAPATNDLTRWRATRERYLNGIYLEWPNFSFDWYANNGLVMNADRLGDEDAVVVWMALGLPEQLLLAWVVFLFDQLGLDVSKLRVVLFEKLRPRQRVLSMGELSRESISKHSPEPRSLTSEELEELRQGWRIYTSDDPERLSAYAKGPPVMPSFHGALGRLVYRYPDVNSGMSIWDERLLHYAVEQGPAATRVVGYTMGYNDTLDCLGDVYLFHRLVSLGRPELASPLVYIDGSSQSMRDCQVRLTPFGQRVLEGKANQVHENGIDDWIGGVHLGDETPVTFRRDGSLVFDC